MKNKTQLLLDNLLQEIEQEEAGAFTFDKARIDLEVNQSASLFADLPLKLLTIFGAILATAFFMGFLFLVDLFDSPASMLVFGSIAMACSVIVIRNVRHMMAETACVAFVLIGCVLFIYGFEAISNSTAALSLSLAAIALGIIGFSGNAIFVFLATLLLNGSLFALITIPEEKNLLHVCTGLLAGLLTYLSLHEARLITHPKLNELYRPVWMGLVLSLIGLVFFLTLRDIGTTGITHLWISSVLLFAALLPVVFKVMQAAGIQQPLHQGLILLACAVMLAPTVFAPSLPAALLILLLSFYMGHRTGLATGIVALVYFVIRFYYDLQLTLLAKSGVLVLTGVLFILGYLLLHNYLKRHAS